MPKQAHKEGGSEPGGFAPSAGRILALAVLTALLVSVVLLAFLLVLPSEFFASLNFPLPKPSMKDVVGLACAVFFIITLSLWVFDAIGFFPFRDRWMSKAIWGTGVSSILATSVLFYRDPAAPEFPLSGIWEAKAEYHLPDPHISGTENWYGVERHVVTVAFDQDAGVYVGQSDVAKCNSFTFKLNPEKREARINMQLECNRFETSTRQVEIQKNNGRITIYGDGPDLKNILYMDPEEVKRETKQLIVLQRHGPFPE